jgi:hypothetical protein
LLRKIGDGFPFEVKHSCAFLFHKRCPFTETEPKFRVNVSGRCGWPLNPDLRLGPGVNPAQI